MKPIAPLLLPACTCFATVLYLCRQLVPTTAAVVGAMALFYGVLMVGAAFVAATDRRLRTTDFLHPLMLALPGCLVFVLRAIQLATTEQWFTIYDLGGQAIVGPLLVKALLLSLVAQFAFLSGYTFAESSTTTPTAVRRDADHKPRYATVAVVAVIVAAGSAAYIIQTGGGPIAYLDGIGRKRDVLTGLGWLTALIQGAPIAAAMFLVASRERGGAGPWLLAFAATLITLMLGARSSFVNSVLAVMIAVNYSRGRFIRPVVIVTIGAFAMAYVQAVGEIRTSSATSGAFMRPQTATLNPVTNVVEYVKTRGTGDRLLVFLAGVPHDIGFQFGATYLRIVETVIPRRWWPGKPGLTEANVYADLFDPGYQENYATAPAGTVADYFLQFGILSVLVLSALHGVVVRRLYRKVRADPDPLVVGFYAAAVMGIGQGLGNLDIATSLVLLWPVLLVLAFRAFSHAVSTRSRSRCSALRPTFGH